MRAATTTDGQIDADQSLKRAEDGTWVAQYKDFSLKTAFQPIFRFVGGKLRPVAFESLLRPYIDDTSVLPSSFFGSLADDDIPVVETIARTLHVRNAPLLPVQARRLFLNFNPGALESKSTFESVLDDLGAELGLSDLSTNDCICEITEKAAVSEPDLRYFVYALRARGYLIAVDDFGAASSDMSRIKALTPDLVKFDGEMVKWLMDSPEGYREFKQLVKKFKELRIKTVIEGLEEFWQVEMAENAGADFVQGFAAAVPRIVPADFSEWFSGKDNIKTAPLVTRPASA